MVVSYRYQMSAQEYALTIESAIRFCANKFSPNFSMRFATKSKLIWLYAVNRFAHLPRFCPLIARISGLFLHRTKPNAKWLSKTNNLKWPSPLPETSSGWVGGMSKRKVLLKLSVCLNPCSGGCVSGLVVSGLIYFVLWSLNPCSSGCCKRPHEGCLSKGS